MLIVLCADNVVAQGLSKLFNRGARVALQRHCRVLERVDLVHIDIDETNIGMLKCSFRCAGEIGVSRPYSNHQIGLACEDIGRRRTRYPDASHRLLVRAWQRALSRLSFTDRYTRSGCEPSQSCGRIRVDDSAASND